MQVNEIELNPIFLQVKELKLKEYDRKITKQIKKILKGKKQENWGSLLFQSQRWFKALMSALAELEEKKEIQCSVESIDHYGMLSEFQKLAHRSDLSKATHNALTSFLISIGWQEDKDNDHQPASLIEQYGYSRAPISLEVKLYEDFLDSVFAPFTGRGLEDNK